MKNISDDKWLEQLEESAAEATDEFEPIKRKSYSSADGQKRKRDRPLLKTSTINRTNNLIYSFSPCDQILPQLPARFPCRSYSRFN